jgi:hypothetical protein
LQGGLPKFVPISSFFTQHNPHQCALHSKSRLAGGRRLFFPLGSARLKYLHHFRSLTNANTKWQDNIERQ